MQTWVNWKSAEAAQRGRAATQRRPTRQRDRRPTRADAVASRLRRHQTRRTTARPKRPLGLTSSTIDDHGQRHRQLELGADEAARRCRPGSRSRPTRKPPTTAPQRAGEAAQRGRRRRRRSGCRPSCWGRGRRRARPSCPATAPTAAARPQPSASIQPTRMPHEPARDRVLGGRAHGQPERGEAEEERRAGAARPGSRRWRPGRARRSTMLPTWMGLRRERARERLLDVGVDPAGHAVEDHEQADAAR